MERHVHEATVRPVAAHLEDLVNIGKQLGWGAFALTLIVGCNRNNDTEPLTPASRPVVETPRSETASASESIARSRCDREQRCGNIGGDEKFSSVDDCLTRVRTDWKDDLSARECPGGVNRTQLDECLTEIRNEDCSSPFDTLERVAACTAGQICES
jgi:hypothetical protein